MRILPATAGALLLIGAVFVVFRTAGERDPSVVYDLYDPCDLSRHPRTPPPTPLTTLAILPTTLGVPREIPPIDHPERVRQAISSGDDAALTRATVSWFEADPAAARDWLASQPTLEDLQPAIAGIAIHLAERGDTDQALLWADTITSAELREDACFTIYAHGARHGNLTPEDLKSAPVPEEKLAELTSGAAAD